MPNKAAISLTIGLAAVALAVPFFLQYVSSRLPPTQDSRPTSGSSSALTLETQSIRVDGLVETWTLQWITAPEPWCDPDGSWPTAPCEGFAYGEAGPLNPVRYRDGHEYERLDLTPLSTGFPDHKAVVRRWPFEDGDVLGGFHAINSPEMDTLRARVHARPLVKVMSFADYDHDGNATEFFFQTEAEAGHLSGVVVGVSSTDSSLHAFGTDLHPNIPLVLQPEEWEALRTASGTVRVMDWKCPDHGATTDTELELEAKGNGIRVISREYADCGREPRKLLKQEYR